MKKLLFAAVFILCGYSVCEAGRRDGFLSKATYVENGNIAEAMAVTVGTTTPVRIFYSTNPQVSTYRDMMFQNVSTNTFRVFIGTHAAVSATSGGRWFIGAGGSWHTYAKDDLWAIFEPAASGTGTLQVLGHFERDSRDADSGQ